MAFKIKPPKRGPRPAQYGQVKIRTGASFGQNIGRNIGRYKMRFPRKMG